MNTLIAHLTNLFAEAASVAFPSLDAIDIEVTPATSDKFGHYQCNSAMKLTKILQKNPREIAESLKAAFSSLPQTAELLQSIEIAGPGFLNLTLKSSYLSKLVEKSLKNPLPSLSKPNRIVIDFSSPNTAKLMHVGHLRSTIIGDTLARLFEFLGHDVVRLNHIGDWGTAFGMLIAYLQQKHPKIITGEEPSDLTHLVNWYKKSKEQFDSDPVFKKAAQKQVVALQGGEPTARKAWETICEISRKEYQKIYDLLEINTQERGESFYNSMLASTIEDLEKKNLIQVCDGAKCIFLDGFINREGEPLPFMVQKSDGGYNYSTTDIAAIRHRINDEKADHLIYVTDAGQAQHFAMLFKAAEAAHYLDPKKVKVNHVPFGLVLGQDGKKFRTRSGDTVSLIDLLNEAVERAKKILLERDDTLPESEMNQIAKAVGIGAVKYADLSCNRTSDYTFSFDKMLRFEGNTAAFLLYAYVRIAGIKRKASFSPDESTQINLKHPSEVTLGLHVARFHEHLQEAAETLLPNRISEYLYQLADKFNAFFRDCQVVGSPEEKERLLLCEATQKTLEQGLKLLGLTPVERM